ncbi:MAG: glycosyltransferase [Acidobacteria bacterium]|nr:glycosyltransferase [Acidobacteriota bacterium]
MSQKPLKSVHITNYYHKNSGGISTSFNNLLAAAARRKRQVRLIVPGEKEETEDVNPYAKIYYVEAKYSPVFDKRYRLIQPWQYIPNNSPIRRILLAERPDLVEVTDKYTISMLGAMIRIGKFKQLGRPVLVHFSAERMDDNIASFIFKGAVGEWLARRVIGNYTLAAFDFHIANSAYTAQEFRKAYKKEENRNRSEWFLNKSWQWLKAPRVPIEERIYVCPRGVNTQIFRPDRKSEAIRKELRERARIPANAVTLLYAGRISPEKNVGLLVEMMKFLAQDPAHDFRLLVAGAGPQEDFLKEETAKNFPGKVILLGHLDKETLAGYYANADVFVHPNPKEPFGIAPLEAMASGAPTVAPDSGGILTYASDENAWLVAPTGASFAKAVRAIVDDPNERARRVNNAVLTALENTREKSTDHLFDAYDRMYADFQRRKELFVAADEAKNFDFAGEVLE